MTKLRNDKKRVVQTARSAVRTRVAKAAPSDVDAIARIGKALAHPLRVRALSALREGELCVCELIELFDLSASTVSKHMSVIAEAGLVVRRRDGRWTYYLLPEHPEGALAYAIGIVNSLSEDDQSLFEDRNRLPGIRCSTRR